MKLRSALLMTALAALAGNASLAAETVFVSLFEDAATCGPDTPELSQAIEDGLLATLFDLDQIASNTAIQAAGKERFADFKDDLRRAIEGGADYLLMVFVEFKVPAKGGRALPSKVTWRFVRMIDSKVLAEGAKDIALDAAGLLSPGKPCFDSGAAIVKAVAEKIWKAGGK